MKVRELVEWLAKFPDQDATVEVLECVPGRGYYQQGGVTNRAAFDPEKHAEYTDMRCNPYTPADAPYKDSRTLLLGINDG